MDDFWRALETLIGDSELIINRPKGTAHPKYPDLIYPVDYGYMTNTASMDGGGIDVWMGSGERMVNGIICTIDLQKRDSEIKILLGCTEEEKASIYRVHNKTESMKGILIKRSPGTV